MHERQHDTAAEKKSHPVKKVETGKELSSEKQPTFLSDPMLAPVSGRIGNPSLTQSHAAILRKAKGSGSSQTGNFLLQLQRQYGNQYVQRVVDLSRKEDDNTVAPEIEQSIQQACGGGQALDSRVRGQMEPAFGSDFSKVRVHTDAGAHSLNRVLNARAFTTGQDIFFNRSEYNPGSSGGRELIAHELTHVVQQTGGVQAKMRVGEAGDQYEQEADRVAEPEVQRKGCSASGCKDEDDEKKLLQTKPANAGEAGVQIDHPLIQDAGTHNFNIGGSPHLGTALRADRNNAVGSFSNVIIQRVPAAIPAAVAAIKALTLAESITAVGTIVSSATSIVGLMTVAQNNKTGVGPDMILKSSKGDYLMSDWDREGLALVFCVIYFSEAERLVKEEQSRGTVLDDDKKKEIKQTAMGNVKFKLADSMAQRLASMSKAFVQQGDGGTLKKTPWGEVTISIMGGTLDDPSQNPYFVKVAKRHHVTVPERPLSFIKRVKLSFESKVDWNLTWNDDIYVRGTKLSATQGSGQHVGIEAEVAFDWDGDTSRYEWDETNLITFDRIPQPHWCGPENPDD